jgi:hypothetical protein
MAVNDVVALYEPPYGSIGARKWAVGASSTIIYPGEIVVRALGGYVVTRMATNKPVVATDYVVGIASSVSTNTASVAGTVDVIPMAPGQVWLAKPNDTTAFDTQAEYDLLVGDRVLFDLTSGAFTILAADGSTYGCVIEPLDIAKYPGRVAFSFRSDVSHLHA